MSVLVALTVKEEDGRSLSAPRIIYAPLASIERIDPKGSGSLVKMVEVKDGVRTIGKSYTTFENGRELQVSENPLATHPAINGLVLLELAPVGYIQLGGPEVAPYMTEVDGSSVTAYTNATGTITLSNGTVATGTFTVDTSITEGIHAQSTLTVDTVLDGETITIDATVYRAKTTPAQAFDVALGANDAAFLDNFKLAVNASGVGDGTDYFAGTTAHPTVAATTNGDTTQVVVARLQGTASNAEATTDTGGGSSLTWADTTLGGGTGTSVAGVAGDTVTIDTVTYTFVEVLSEDHADAVANQVHWVTTDAVALDNFKSAINLTGTIGTDYSTGTVIHPTVTATTNGAATQVVAAKTAGTGPNDIDTTETGSTTSWGAAKLAGGLAATTTGVTVDDVELMSGSEVFDTDLSTTATAIAANITANTSSPNYTAAAVGAIITITDASNAGSDANAFVVVHNGDNGLSTSDVDMADGVNGVNSLDLPAALVDDVKVIYNPIDSGGIVRIWPASTEQIDSLGANMPYYLAVGGKITFVCLAAGVWTSVVG